MCFTNSNYCRKTSTCICLLFWEKMTMFEEKCHKRYNTPQYFSLSDMKTPIIAKSQPKVKYSENQLNIRQHKLLMMCKGNSKCEASFTKLCGMQCQEIWLGRCRGRANKKNVKKMNYRYPRWPPFWPQTLVKISKAK